MMSFLMMLTYHGEKDHAAKFVKEMMDSGRVDRIRKLDGCIQYGYYFPYDNPNTVILIDEWKDQYALDAYHASDLMKQVAMLREKYDLHVTSRRLIDDISNAHIDDRFLRK